MRLCIVKERVVCTVCFLITRSLLEFFVWMREFGNEVLHGDWTICILEAFVTRAITKDDDTR